MNHYETIIFDLDGTLLYTLDDLRNAVNFALRNQGYPERGLDEIRHFVGRGIRNLMQRSVPEGISEESFETAFADFRAYYAEHQMDNTRPYEGVAEVALELQNAGYKVAIVSNKIDTAVKNLNSRFFHLNVAIGEQEGMPRKPEPDMVYLALDLLGADPSTAVYIGDSDIDLKTAANSHLPCISVTWGFRSIEELKAAGATIFAHTPEELKQLV